MVAIIEFVFFVITNLLGLLIAAIIVSAIMSWLVAFDVINLRNRFVHSVSRFLESVTGPIMRPVQKVVPSLGGVDISPIIVILLLQGAQSYLLPSLKVFLLSVVP